MFFIINLKMKIRFDSNNYIKKMKLLTFYFN